VNLPRRSERVLVIASLAAAVAALSGALLASSSTSTSLEQLALGRLGRADLIVYTPGFVRDDLAGDLTSDEGIGGALDAAAPVLVLHGVVTSQTTGRQAPAAIHGVDDRFWRFHHSQGISGPSRESVFLAPKLAAAIGSVPGDQVTVRTPDTGEASPDSLYGPKDGGGLTLELLNAPIDERTPGLELSFANNEASGFVAFVSMDALQRRAGGAPVNVILLSAKPGADLRPDAVRSALQRHLTLEDRGLALRTDAAGAGFVLESATGLVDDARADLATRAAIDIGALPTEVMTTVVSGIVSATRAIPYAFVSAIELQTIAPEVQAEELSRPPVVLNEIAARRLAVATGGTVSIDFPVWVEPGRFESHTAEFEVAGVVPISGAAADPTLTPYIPGVSGASTMRGWRPAFPFESGRIRPEDEEYWTRHNGVPAAFIAPQVARALWRTRSGALTSIRIAQPAGVALETARAQFIERLSRNLSPDVIGILVRSLRSEAHIAAATNGFGDHLFWISLGIAFPSLTLALACFTTGRFGRTDALVLSAAGLAAGALLGLAFGAVLLVRLHDVWPGTDLQMHPSAVAVAGPLAGGAVVAALLSWIAPMLTYRAARAMLAVVVGVMAVWTVYAYTRRSGPARDGLKDGTGGFGLIARTVLPVVHDPNGADGRAQLGLTDLEPVRVSAIRVHDGDDASGTTPLRALHPRIVSISRTLAAEGRFSFVAALDRSEEERANPWLLLDREQRDRSDPSEGQSSRIVPVVSGTTALATLFGGRLGADIGIAAGVPVRLRAVAALADSVLDDALVMSEQDFLNLFPLEPGYQMLLLEAPAARVDEVAARLSTSLASFGVTTERANERLEKLLAVHRQLSGLTFSLITTGLLLAAAGFTTYTLGKP